MAATSSQPTTQHYLALDLGATSVRAVVGIWNGKTLRLREVHRAPHLPIEQEGALHWNFEHIQVQCLRGLERGLAVGPLSGISCDSWAVDHGLLNAKGELLAWPFSYQDTQRTRVGAEELQRYLPPHALFLRSGSPYTPISSLHQLLATRRIQPRLFDQTDKMLLIPDLVHHLLSGEIASEFCAASTTALCSPTTQDWNTELINTLNLTPKLLPPLRPSPARLGSLRPELAAKLNCAPIPLYLTAGHDTAAAVIGAPREHEGDLVISSGTWMMLALPGSEPLISPEICAAGFGNYGLPGGNWMFVTGIMGLYLLERLRREEELEELPELCIHAAQAPEALCLLDPTHESLTGEGRLLDNLRRVAELGGETLPTDTASLVRTILESLAAYAAISIETMQELAGRNIERLIVVGGGVRNELLNQMLADATGRPVIAGNPESSAGGNVLLQMLAAGELECLDQVQGVARASFTGRSWQPRATRRAATTQRFQALRARLRESVTSQV